MSERLPSIVKGLELRTDVFELFNRNPTALVQLPGLTSEEVEEFKELYSSKFSVIEQEKDSEGTYELFLGGYRNA